MTEPNNWRHVRSANNPADILSRDLNPRELVNSSEWWHGPVFLSHAENLWPKNEFACSLDSLPEQRKTVARVTTTNCSVIIDLLNDRSSLDKTCRILAYCMRMQRSHRPTTCTAFVSYQEIRSVLCVICKMVQKQTFPVEYKVLSNNKNLNSSSTILSLSPFMTDDGLIRVGGRLNNANLDFDARHPILLPRNHILTQRILEREHMRNAHAGTQATMAAVRQHYWPISLRSSTRRVIRKCVTCFKSKPVVSEVIMGSLPTGRVTVSRPFFHCGVDYAGPFILRESKRRNARTHKAYLAVFVCFAIKAVHLEIVSDLTSDCFLAALKRFVARRGKPSCMYSDNGTTFVGAQRQLKEF